MRIFLAKSKSEFLLDVPPDIKFLSTHDDTELNLASDRFSTNRFLRGGSYSRGGSSSSYSYNRGGSNYNRNRNSSNYSYNSNRRSGGFGRAFAGLAVAAVGLAFLGIFLGGGAGLSACAAALCCGAAGAAVGASSAAAINNNNTNNNNYHNASASHQPGNMSGNYNQYPQPEFNQAVLQAKRDVDNTFTTHNQVNVQPYSGQYTTSFIDPESGSHHNASLCLFFTPDLQKQGFRISGQGSDIDGSTVVEDGFAKCDGTCWWIERAITGDVGLLMLSRGQFNFQQQIFHGTWLANTMLSPPSSSNKFISIQCSW